MHRLKLQLMGYNSIAVHWVYLHSFRCCSQIREIVRNSESVQTYSRSRSSKV